MEWFALALGVLALMLAVLIGAALALIVEGSEASTDARDERPYSVSDASSSTPNDQDAWRRVGRDRERTDADIIVPTDGRAGVSQTRGSARR